MMRTIHPIEAESYRRMRARRDTSHLGPLTRAVVERVVHASADLEYVDSLVTEEDHLEAGLAALRAGRPVVVDATMVRSGVTSRATRCLLDDPRTRHHATANGWTRSESAFIVAAGEVGPGAVWVVGNAPTALERLLTIADVAEPALVIGLPVGFVGATESKEHLRATGLAQVSNIGEKGGSGVAAAALNALVYAAQRCGDDAMEADT